MAPQHIRGGVLTVRQVKTGAEVIPVPVAVACPKMTKAVTQEP
jgi:hypothetical protein